MGLLFSTLQINIAYKQVFISLISTSILLLFFIFYKYIYPKKVPSYRLLLLGFSILPLISILRPGTYESGDLTLHTSRLMSFYKNLQEGVLVPRWAGELNAGYGYALFNFYYPLPYYLGSFFHFLGFNFLNSIKVLLITTYIGSGFAFFYFLKQRFQEKYAFIGSIFYLFAPYHLVDMHFRVAIGETTAYLFLPLSFLFFEKQFYKPNIIWLFAEAAAVSLLVLSHAGIALSGFGLLLIYIIFISHKSGIIKLIENLFGAFLGVLFSAFYSIPAIIESNYAHQNLGGVNLEFLKFSELLFSRWRLGLLFQGPHGELSFLLGYAHILIILLALYLILFKSVKNNLLIFFTLISIIFIFMLQKVSYPLWNFLPFLKSMLLTYRLLLIVAFSTSVLAALICQKLKNKNLNYIVIIVCIGSTILNWGNRRNIPEIKDPQIANYLPYISANEEGAWNAVSSERPADHLWQNVIPEKHLESITAEFEIIKEERNSIYHKYTVFVKKDGLIKENTYFFPGWNLKINNETKDIEYKSYNFPGIITFKVNNGLQTIELMFKDTPIRYYATLISQISFAFSVFYICFLRKKVYD